LNAFADQAITLTVQPPRVFFGNAGYPHHAFGSPRRYAIGERGNRSVSTRSVFTRSHSPIHLQACRINNVIAHPMRFELPV